MAIGIISGIGAAVTCLEKLSSAVSAGQEKADFQQCMQQEAKKLREIARHTKGEDAQKLMELASRFSRAAEGDMTAWNPSALAAYQAHSG